MHEKTTERRQDPRLGRAEPLLLQVTAIDEIPPPESLTAACTTVDVSVGGLRLRANERIDTGSRIDLKVDVGGRPGELMLSGEVRWSVQDGESYLIGIQLHDRPGFDLLAWKALFAR